MHLIRMILRAAMEKSNIYLSPEFRLPKMKVRGVIPLLSDWGLSEYENGGVTCEKETAESDDGSMELSRRILNLSKQLPRYPVILWLRVRTFGGLQPTQSMQGPCYK